MGRHCIVCQKMGNNEYVIDPSSPYVPEDYWNKRRMPNSTKNDIVNTSHRRFLQPHLESRQSLIELGPGDGRLFQLYSGKRVSTLDLTRQHEETLNQKADTYGFQLSQYWYTRPQDPFPFDDKQFELAVASQVLIHVPFSLIRHTLSELLRISGRVVLVSGLSERWPKTQADALPGTYCFTHDYEQLLGDCGARIVDTGAIENFVALAAE